MKSLQFTPLSVLKSIRKELQIRNIDAGRLHLLRNPLRSPGWQNTSYMAGGLYPSERRLQVRAYYCPAVVKLLCVCQVVVESGWSVGDGGCSAD